LSEGFDGLLAAGLSLRTSSTTDHGFGPWQRPV